MNGTRHREVGEYLRRLQRAMGDLPAERREEILAEIEEHIAEDLAEQPTATDADVRNVLQRVGDPEDIAEEARERFEITPVSPRFKRPAASWTDTGAVTLLVLGSLMITPFYRPEGMVVAWGAGVVLLWMSEVWSTGDKIRVTLVLPLGALSAVAIQGSGDEGFVYFAIILFAAVWPPTYLGLKLRRSHLASDSDIAVEARMRFAPEPARTEDRRRRNLLIGGALALVVLVATLVAFLSTSGDDTPLARVTEAQFGQVGLGDSKDEVSRILGGPGEGGSLVSGLDPLAREEPQDVGEQQFSDCWTYSLTGSAVGRGSEAAVCFDSSDEVVYTRLRVG